jgi:hypothetical protein
MGGKEVSDQKRESDNVDVNQKDTKFVISAT